VISFLKNQERGNQKNKQTKQKQKRGKNKRWFVVKKIPVNVNNKNGGKNESWNEGTKKQGKKRTRPSKQKRKRGRDRHNIQKKVFNKKMADLLCSSFIFLDFLFLL